MAKITAGVHGDFKRYVYHRDAKGLWLIALGALDAKTWRDLRRHYRVLRERLDWYAAWNELWEKSGRVGPVRDQLAAIRDSADSVYDALSACDRSAAALLSRHTKQRPIEYLMMEIAEMRAAAARAFASLPEDKGGPSPDLPLHRLLRSLAELWEAEHGARPPRPRWVDGEDPDSGEDVKLYQDNPFLTLCEAVVKLARAKSKGKKALAGQIIRVVFKRT